MLSVRFYCFFEEMNKKLRTAFLGLLLCCSSMVWGDDVLIEHQGDHYVINMDALKPDSEMTLMEVLQLCPELTIDNSFALNENYVLCVDDVDVLLDNITFLKQVKAQEIESIDIYMNPSVSQGVGGTEAVINIRYKKSETKSTAGKVSLEGSTYGNGLLYGDVKTQQRNIGIRGYALMDLYYAKATPVEGGTLTQRQMAQNAHVTADWDISSVDNLKVKLFQQFTDYKERYRHPDESTQIPIQERLGSMMATYTRTLNDKEATLMAEAGGIYLSNSTSGYSTYQIAPYFFAEYNTPLFCDDLWMLAGWEINYDHVKKIELVHQKFLKNDFYLQMDYNSGPWIVTLGARHTLLNYWNRFYHTENSQQATHHRSATTFLATAGYKWGRHYVQGTFNRDFFIPSFDDFYEDVMDQTVFTTSYLTNLMWRAELRYNYQKKNLAFFGVVTHSWITDMPTPREALTSVKTTITWNQGALRLTAGANYYHQHISAGIEQGKRNDNFFTLKLSPTLLLGKGFRLSAMLLYQSKERYLGNDSHLYASVKVNKDLGRHWNLYADFHDLTGLPTISLEKSLGEFFNRALTVGMTYRF